MSILRSFVAAAAAAVSLAVVGAIQAADEEGLEFFEKQVRPILAARCYECHSGQAEKLKGGLRLDSRAAALKGGDTGPAVVPGKPQESLLIDAINYGDVYQMPPKSKLPAEEIAVLTKWIERGAPWPENSPSVAAEDSAGEFDLARRQAEHWCWQPIRSPAPPPVKDLFWSKQPLDQFILAKLEEMGLTPSPPADAHTLIRRAYFDLTGLPPTVAELEEFLALSRSPRLPLAPSWPVERESGRGGEWESGGYEALLDRLLASPRFGERWGRHWLDLVRYAESRGHEFDYNIPNAFEYRDYVIRALNADVPYDQFVVEHVAGDLLSASRPPLRGGARRQPPETFNVEQRNATAGVPYNIRWNPYDGSNESIIGTGFWFLGEWVHSPVDIRKDECDRLDNMLDVFSKTFLGVTVACARCHDHKFDAISQRDYYALAGYLQSSSYRLARFETWRQDRQVADELAALDANYRPRLAAAVAAALRERLDALAATMARGGEEVGSDLGVTETDLRGGRVIVDYAHPPPGAWMTNGPTFGDGPVKAGQLVLTREPAQPLEVAAYGAARRDWTWGDLAAAPTSENDPARLSAWLRAGRTLKTPTFTLTSGQVHYLIEGAGQVYAAVDSHLMNNGPLHAELIKETGGNSDLPMRWITHSLPRYVGHRVHLQFSPLEGEDFRVLMVVEGKDRPAAPQDRPNRLLARLPPVDAERGSEIRLAACRQLIRETLDLLAADRIAADPLPCDRAALANWLIAHGDFEQHSPRELSELLAAYTAQRDQIAARIQPHSRLCLALWDGTPVDENLLIRGNHKTVGPAVPRRLLEALEASGGRPMVSGGREPPETKAPGVRGRKIGVSGADFQPADPSGSGRLEVACQLIDPQNPLVARVIVNRVWQHLMGRGIVPSVDNFGVLGQPPTHPELLDYLAAEFINDGWSLKRLIRRIMLSSTYQMASGGRELASAGREPSEAEESGVRSQESGSSGEGLQPAMPFAESADPENLLFHRQNLKRLEGEALRDAILAISGRLDTAMYGAGVPVYLTPFMQGRGRPKESGPLDGAGRRSIYQAVRRNFLSPMMLAFDTPIPFTTIGRRNVSNVPAQALILMNDPFVVEQSRLWAGRVLSDSSATPHQRIRRMYLAAYSRQPTAAETAAALAFLNEQGREYSAGQPSFSDERVWADLGHVLFNAKEFLLVR